MNDEGGEEHSVELFLSLTDTSRRVQHQGIKLTHKYCSGIWSVNVGLIIVIVARGKNLFERNEHLGHTLR